MSNAVSARSQDTAYFKSNAITRNKNILFVVIVNTFASSLQSPKEVCNVRLGSSVSRNSWAAPSPIASTRRLKQNSTSLKQSHMLKKDGLKRSSLEVNTVGDESIITEIASSKELAV